ncbi:hypothetical protein H072_292 [Dactylellina haptotyla CBS 200.50]|uniref:Uncharacterized protein n=1 Tax=Dactylellina haptotyla (strain CBS 200.50) TaxID=1284197 RepID=S8ASL3_DACHA|nr:hypothetical protein H072_292 [Dactylellina haptotyla CBS 200.50]
MLQFIWIVTFVLAFVAQAAPVKVRVNHVSVGNEPIEPDYARWTIFGGTSASFTNSGVAFKPSVPSSELKGSRYKVITPKMQSFLGERVVGEGISTDAITGIAITLILTDLSAGTHSLLTYHNAWDNLSKVANIKITINDVTGVSEAASSYVTFSVTSGQTVTIVYTPLATSGVTDLRAFVNAREIDGSNVADTVKYPIPGHGDEHYESDGAVK